jgi:hypothetical protein
VTTGDAERPYLYVTTTITTVPLTHLPKGVRSLFERFILFSFKRHNYADREKNPIAGGAEIYACTKPSGYPLGLLFIWYRSAFLKVKEAGA